MNKNLFPRGRSGFRSPRAALAGLFALGLLFSAAESLRAGEGETPFEPRRTIYVSPAGDDAADGLAPERAPASISAAARLVEPGDLVLVSGGVYRESVSLERAGTEDAPIVFRGVSGETVVVTSGHEPADWRRIPGTRSTWEIEAVNTPGSVWDRRTMRRYALVLDLAMAEGMPGSYFHEPASGRLYVNPYERRDPSVARVVLSGDEVGFSISAAWNHVESFVIEFQQTGIFARGNVEQSSVRANTIYGCENAIRVGGSNFTIEANYIFHNDQTGINIHSGTSGTVIRENLLRENGARGPFYHPAPGGVPHNVAFYGSPVDARFIDNMLISDGDAYHSGNLFRDKTIGRRLVFSGNVLAGGGAQIDHRWNRETAITGNTMIHSLQGAGGTSIVPEAVPEKTVVAGNIVIPAGAAGGAGFADPARHDYRLHAGSPHLGGGAYPEAAEVRYVSPEGEDTADGASPETAWRTISRAAAEMTAGRTVYVLPGIYPESIRIAGVVSSENEPAALKTYGRGRVVIDGQGRPEPGLVIAGSENLVVEGFVFRDFPGRAVEVLNSGSVRLEENIIDRSGTNVFARDIAGLSLVNNTFNRSGRVLEAAGCDRIVLRNNLLAETGTAPLFLDAASRAGLVSESNTFSGPGASENLALFQLTVKDIHPVTAHESLVLEEPEYNLPLDHLLSFAGLFCRPVGARPAALETSEIAVENFRVVSASPERVVVQWETPYDYPDARLSWQARDGGEERTINCEQDYEIKRTTRAVALTGLEPGTAWRVSLSLREGERMARKELEFTTPLERPAPVTRFVSTGGSDENDGLSRENALRSITAASQAANPGDTVLVAPGVYREELVLWHGGLSEDEHTIFRSIEPGRAVIDLAEMLTRAISGSGIAHVTIDGFSFRGIQYGNQYTPVTLDRVNDLRLVNNIFESHSGIRARQPGGMTGRILNIHNSRDILIEDNLFDNTFRSMDIIRCENVVINHNTFRRAGIRALVAVPSHENARWRISNNIFYRNGKPGYQAISFGHGLTRDLELSHNLHWPAEGGPVIFAMKMETGEIGPAVKTPEELREIYGLGENIIMADPMFRDPGTGDFTLHPDSPARGAAADGSDLGMRNPPAGKP